ncbi:MAG: hypothetical protein KJ065_23480 [Anaerolineae bacterium]|nr:hypothetical protein [Anaerolineae bacterium]
MSFDSGYDDHYEAYESYFDPMKTDRQARRKRKPKVKHQPKKSHEQIVEAIADTQGLEGGFETTYVPGLFEEGWLLSALRSFYDQALITDVLARVRGGKEANVYRCAAHPTTGVTLVAAKVYRPRMFRNLRNDKLYREGRQILRVEGGAVKENDRRTMRALDQGSAYGSELAHTSWLMHEYRALETLYMAGAAVPRPIAVSENAILMGYAGDGSLAAPALSDVALDVDEARSLYDEVVRNLHIMLRHRIIHGDLSAYNILYWDDRVTIIDFPQVVDIGSNRQAANILHRDVVRVCEYFSEQGVDCDGDVLFERLWRRYKATSSREDAADASRAEIDEE